MIDKSHDIGKVLVTGSTGLLGSEILKTLSNNNISCLGLYHTSPPFQVLPFVEYRKIDILDTLSLLEVLKECTHVVHTAAVVSFSKYKKKLMYETNVIGTRNLVDCMLQFNNLKLVHISSVAALGRTDGSVIDESSKWNEGVSHTYYAKTKYLSELEVFRGIEEGLDATILNPSVILSPPIGDRSSGKLINYVKKGAVFYPKGFLNAVDARDVALAVKQALTTSTGESRFILNGFRITYKEFFEQAASRLGVKPPSLPTNGLLNYLIWILDSLVCFFTRKEPIITKETLQLSKKDYVYQPINQQKLNIVYRKPTDTLDWACQ